MEPWPLMVLAKAPESGRVKTRLTPPLTPDQAALVAGAALQDTLAVARSVAPTVLVLDGPPGAWIPDDVRVIEQRGAGLDRRIANAFAAIGPALLIGMDTPQVTPGLLRSSMAALAGADAVLGPALDGGFWAIGTTRVDASLFEGVPMSSAATGQRQYERLVEAGLSVELLPPLQDIDTIDDLRDVAARCPELSRTRAVFDRFMQGVPA